MKSNKGLKSLESGINIERVWDKHRKILILDVKGSLLAICQKCDMGEQPNVLVPTLA